MIKDPDKNQEKLLQIYMQTMWTYNKSVNEAKNKLTLSPAEKIPPKKGRFGVRYWTAFDGEAPILEIWGV